MITFAATPSTALKGIEISRLTAIILGGPTKRSANSAAAFSRLMSVAGEHDLPPAKVAKIVETAADLTAAEDNLRALIDSAKGSATSALAILAGKSEAAIPPAFKVAHAKAATVKKLDEEMPDFLHRTGDPAQEAEVADHWRRVAERNRQAVTEAEMAKKTETPKAKGAEKTRGKREPGAPNKNALVAALLVRAEGCTNADILAATGWPTVSVPQQAKIAKLNLRKEKLKGEPTRYWGTPVKTGKAGK